MAYGRGVVDGSLGISRESEDPTPAPAAPTDPHLEDAPPEPVQLHTPRDGVPLVVTDPGELAALVGRFAAGTGPVAVDAERASGHRYGQRAFLVQLRREGAGTALVDPAALPDLGDLGTAIAGTEWVLHAAGQDLPCLAAVGMRPTRLFDTELASRLAGFTRVGLAAVTEQLLGVALAKEHSAVDWSTRPLPEPWLRYAALDVEVLVELRDALADELAAQGKLDWAQEEFAAIVTAPPPAPRLDPWRRTSGLHKLRSRRQLAVLQALWTEREALAEELDVAPGRLLPDASLVAAAQEQPAGARELAALKAFTGRGARRHLTRWARAIEAGRAVPEAELPAQHLPNEGPPPARAWADRDPPAARRLARARAGIVEIAGQLRLPVENLVSPDAVRRLLWDPPPQDAESVRAALVALGARPWQIELTLDVLIDALGD